MIFAFIAWLTIAPAGFYVGFMASQRFRSITPDATANTAIFGVICALFPPVASALAAFLILNGETE